MGELLVIVAIIGLITGAICAAIASSKERNAVGWFFGGLAMGFCLGLIGAIIIIVIAACLSDLKAQRFRDMAIERENRRLREQLLQEQMKAEAFRQHAATRLDAHDVHLGLDTRAVNPALAGPAHAPLSLGFDNSGFGAANGQNGDLQSVPPAVPGMPAMPPQVSAVSRQWFYEVSGDSRGPVSEEQIAAMLQTGQLNSQSLLWTEQLGEWRPAAEIMHLRRWVSP